MNVSSIGEEGSIAKAISPSKSEKEKTSEEMMRSPCQGVDMPTEEEFGVRNPRKLANPRLPSEKEVKEHNLTHLPYRSWCAHCVAGKGKAAPHRRQNRKDGLPVLHLDYCFLSTNGDPLAIILVTKERQTRHTLSTVVPLKGASIQFPARRVLAFLEEFG